MKPLIEFAPGRFARESSRYIDRHGDTWQFTGERWLFVGGLHRMPPRPSELEARSGTDTGMSWQGGGGRERMGDLGAMNKERARAIAADALEREPSLAWIPVSLRLPDDDREVLVWEPIGRRDMARWHGDRWVTSYGCRAHNVTHWRELPDGPSKET